MSSIPNPSPVDGASHSPIDTIGLHVHPPLNEGGHTNSSQECVLQSVLRHHDLWFEDGSIVLRAQDPMTLFRVHRAILARHSEVFRNMFAIPQPQHTDSLSSPASSSRQQQRIVKHHRTSQSVDFVKEPMSELKMMGSLSRRLSSLGTKSFSIESLTTTTTTTARDGIIGSINMDIDEGNGDANGYESDHPHSNKKVRHSHEIGGSINDVDEADAERIEGCDVVDMHDSSRDVASLLHALYDGPQWTDNSPADFLIVSGVLRLAHKYLIDGLRTKALEHLHQAWPTTLQGWDLREDRRWAWNGGSGGSTGSTIVGVGQREWNSNGLSQNPNTGTGTMSVGAERRFPHPIHVINLARSVNAPSLLPSAFYDLSRLTFSQIFENLGAIQAQTFRSMASNVDTGLSLSDIQKLSIGKEQSHQAITSLITNLGNVRCSITGGGGGSGVKMWCCALGHNNTANTINGSGGHTHSHSHSISHPKSHHAHCHSTCHSPVSCRRDFIELVELATQHYLFDRERGHTDPLYVAEELGQLKSAEYSECKACAVALECWSMRERERIWKCLPAWFKVGSGWEGLV